MILPKYRPEQYSKEAIAALMPAVKRREQDAINKVILLMARMAIKLGRRDQELQLQALEKLVEVVKMMSERPQEEKDPRTFIIMSIRFHINKQKIRNNLFHVCPAYFKKTGKSFSKKYFFDEMYKSQRYLDNLNRGQDRHFAPDSIDLIAFPEPDWSFTKEVLDGLRPPVQQVILMKMQGMSDVEIAEKLGKKKQWIGALRKEAQDYARKRFEDNGMGEIVRSFEKQSAESRGLPDDDGRLDDSAHTEAGTGA